MVEIGLFIAAYAIALDVKNSSILVEYCNRNPNCSIRSNAILPAFFAILSLAAPIMAIIRNGKIEAQVEAEAAAMAKTPVSIGKKRKKRR